MSRLLLAMFLAASSGATLAQTLACNPEAPRTDPGTGFSGAAEQVLARGGNSGPAWEWAVNDVKGSLDWTSGVSYQWTVTYSGTGAATLQIRNQGVLVLTLTKSSGMIPGNALQLVVSTNPSIGPSTTIAASASTINGQAVSGAISQTGNNLESSQSLYFYHPSMSQGFSASGTVTLTYASLPSGARVDFQVRSGNVPCNNQAPTVALSAPAAQSIHHAGTPITLSANAQDADGTVAQVEFLAGGTVIATDTTAPYSFDWTNALPGVHTITARATDNAGDRTTSAPVSITVNVLPTVALSSPAQNATFTAPANIPIAAQVADTDGSIASVEFYQGTTLITTRTAPPYSFDWTGVPQGTYSLTAKAIDNSGGSVTSAAVNVTVNSGVAKLHFIHADHLNTPRLVANQSGQTVWRLDHREPFGDTPPDENPSGLGAFEFPLRSGGWQYADKETGEFWNWMRTYSAIIGRFDQFDPIGLFGGLNGYAFVHNNPLRRVDPMGLFTGPVHEEITREVAKSCPKLAGTLPTAVSAVDSLSGSQLPGMSFMHGMCSPGQSPSQGMTQTEEYIDQEISKCTGPSLAKALHAGQDKHSPSHRNCQTWPGRGAMTMAQLMAHAAADRGTEGRAEAGMESEFIIARVKARCPCLCE